MSSLWGPITCGKRALERNGPPVYVRHEIVHNRHVVDELKALGAVFVEEIMDAFAERYELRVETVSTVDEDVFFPLPRELRGEAAE